MENSVQVVYDMLRHMYPDAIGVIIFSIGLCFGSFYNVVIYRIPRGLSLNGRSYCPKCQSLIRWYENIPVLSYVVLQAKCSHCKLPISSQYPIIELLTAYVFVSGYFLQPESVIYFAVSWSICILVIGWLEQLSYPRTVDV